MIYTWTGTGVTGNDSNPKMDTSALAPGEYTVTGTVKEGKTGREGMKPWETATCTAGITVKAFEPPTISCSASPSTIKPGDTATITAVGVSPQNRPLTYSYSASAGTVTGSGTTAEYSSAGAPTGAVGITCNVSDDKGHTAELFDQPDDYGALCAAGTEDAGAVLDQLCERQEAADARGQRSQGLPGSGGIGSEAAG